MATQLTGRAIHEWLGVLLVLPLLSHLLLNWAWLRAAALRFLGYLPGEVRFNAMLNAAFFVAMTGTIVSGLLISETVLPALGLTPGHDPTLRWWHSFSADTMLVVLGLHLGMKWRWIRRIFGNLLRPTMTRPFGKDARPAAASMRALAGHATAGPSWMGQLATVRVPRSDGRGPATTGRSVR